MKRQLFGRWLVPALWLTAVFLMGPSICMAQDDDEWCGTEGPRPGGPESGETLTTGSRQAPMPVLSPNSPVMKFMTRTFGTLTRVHILKLQGGRILLLTVKKPFNLRKARFQARKSQKLLVSLGSMGKNRQGLVLSAVGSTGGIFLRNTSSGNLAVSRVTVAKGRLVGTRKTRGQASSFLR